VQAIGGNATLLRTGNDIAINLGTTHLNATETVDLAVLNGAIGLADLLSGSFTVSGPAAFKNTGLAPFSGLAAGAKDAAPAISFSSPTAGEFTETITLSPVGHNASGYAGALAPLVLTITAGASTIATPNEDQLIVYKTT
jgi:hypothetical protein